ncbi:MAG: hypothetical protein RIQ48_138 [Pseudomonadota bacterium]|jgi:uncharacterized protein (TIGR02466 family)
MTNNVNVLSPFGPRIAKLRIPKNLINKLNKEIDRIVDNQNLSKKFDYSKKLVGQVSQEIQLPKAFINKNLKSFLHKATKGYIEKAMNKKITKFKINNVWIVRQFENEYNPIHYHDGHISGAGYLKVPKSLNEDARPHKHNLKTHGTIDFIHGSRSFLNKCIYNHQPKVGDMLLFPNYLMHTVYPFQSHEERRSFSFNAVIDEKIANVFKHE